MIIHMRHTLWTGISETNVNVITSATRTHAFNNNNNFRVFAECIFLYSCELWTTTKTINDSIDSFHRRQLRYALGIKYPRVITNQQLYDVTKCEPWSIVNERRRLSWLGHMMRLNPETPARQYFKEALRPVKRKPGRPPMTWITTIQQDLSKNTPKSSRHKRHRKTRVDVP